MAQKKVPAKKVPVKKPNPFQKTETKAGPAGPTGVTKKKK